MKTLAAILILLTALVASAQTRVTVNLTVTNPAPVGATFTINASTRTFTNSTTTTTIQTNATIGGTATNLYVHLLANPPSGPTFVSLTGTNTLAIAGSVAQAMTASSVSNWASISYTTQTVTEAAILRVPISSEPTSSNRVRHASWLVEGIRDYPTNAWPGTTAALTNFLGKTNSGQVISGTNTFTGANVFSNSAQSIVGGMVSNAMIVGGNITNSGANEFRGTNTFGRIVLTNMLGNSVTISNLVVTNGFQSYTSNDTQVVIGKNASVGGSTNSLAIGLQAIATNDFTTAIGYNPTASGYGAFAIGRLADAAGRFDFALGNTAQTIGGLAVAIGANAFVSATNGFAVGNAAIVTHTNSMAIGNGAETTENNQIRIGTSAYYLSFPGSAAMSNSISIGNAELFNPPTSMTGAILLNNGVAASADMTNGVAVNAVSGAWRYRQSGDGSAGTNYFVHNRAGEVVGSGTDYSLTTTYAFVDFSGTDPEFNTLPTAGTYLILATVDWEGGTLNDEIRFKLYNATAAADIANSEIAISADGNAADHSNTIQAIVTLTSASRIQLYGKNNTGNRGTVNSTLTKLSYVRLY